MVRDIAYIIASKEWRTYIIYICSTVMYCDAIKSIINN